MTRHWIIAASLALAAVAVFSACGNDGVEPDSGSTPPANGTAGADDRIKIATTVAPITSLAENIAGAAADVEGIVPEGTNSHTFEPQPSVARMLAEADVIFVNGLRLEEPTIELARANKQDSTEIVQLGDMTITEGEWKFDFSFPEEGGDPNPHLWPNVAHARRYAGIIHEKLAELDPDNKATYDANFNELAARLDALDQAIAAAVQTVPEENRKLITYHDSWAYWSGAYGFTIIGAVQPSDFTEPSPREVADLIQQVNAENVPAVFGSEIFPSDTLETIANESGAEYVDELRDDDLPGQPGDDLHSYIGLMLTNMQIMLPALGGNTDALANIDPGLVFGGDSTAKYPQ